MDLLFLHIGIMTNKYIKTYESYNSTPIWYRGITSNTTSVRYVWLTSDKNHAKKYANLNKDIYGGDEIVNEIIVDEDKNNILDFSMYDMDDRLDENDIKEFLLDVDCSFFEYLDLFDLNNDIVLSRLVNTIIVNIFEENDCDGFKIMESGVLTMLIKNDII